MLGIFRKKAAHHKALLDKATREAETGRRLAIHDRETGLFAYWYLQQRFEEEAQRATRYNHNLSLMVIEINSGNGFASRDALTAWLRQNIRVSDLPGHLGDGRYLVLMPETDAEAASILARRLQQDIGSEIAVGLSIYPEDGSTLSELQKLATHCLSLVRPSERVA